MELEHALDGLRYLTPRLPVGEVNCIRDNKDAAIPLLLQSVKDALHYDWDNDEEFLDSLYSVAMYLLAEFRVKEAFSYLLEFLKMGWETTDMFIEDCLSEDFARILASVATKHDIPAIKSVALDSTTHTNNKDAAIGTMFVLYNEGVLSRDDLVAFVATILEENNDNELLVSFVVDKCAEHGLHELYDQIGQMYKDGLVDETIFPAKDFFEIAEAQPVEDGPGRLSYQYIADTIKAIKWWNVFGSSLDIGRNDPCPCGSGLKFKKCCGAYIGRQGL